MKANGFLLVPFALALAGCTPDQASRTPVATAQAAVPGAPTPQGNARFVGRWTGFWDGGSQTALTVTSITPEGEAVGSYQFAQNAPIQFRSPIENDRFRIGNMFTFTLRPDGKIFGERLWQGYVNTVQLTRS